MTPTTNPPPVGGHWQEGQGDCQLCPQPVFPIVEHLLSWLYHPRSSLVLSWRCSPKVSSEVSLLLLLCHLTHSTVAIIILSQVRFPHTHKLNLQVTLTDPANSNSLPSSPCPSFGGTSGCSLPHRSPHMGRPPVVRMAQISSWQSVLCSWNM